MGSVLDINIKREKLDGSGIPKRQAFVHISCLGRLRQVQSVPGVKRLED